MLSLSYAVSYQSSVNCTNKEVITAGELQYFHKWKEMLRTLTTPISSRAPSATSQLSAKPPFLPITTYNSIPDTSNYEGDGEDNDDEEDDEDSNDESDETEEEIVSIFNNNKRAAEQNDEPIKKKNRWKNKKRINKQKNKETKNKKIII